MGNYNVQASLPHLIRHRIAPYNKDYKAQNVHRMGFGKPCSRTYTPEAQQLLGSLIGADYPILMFINTRIDKYG